MPVSDVLKNFRQGDYGKKDIPEEKESSDGPRMIKLTDEEVKELQGYQKAPGEEQQCLVSGRLGEDGKFSVVSVHSPEGGPGPNEEKEMAEKMMGPMGGPPMMQQQTMPSPS